MHIDCVGFCECCIQEVYIFDAQMTQLVSPSRPEFVAQMTVHRTNLPHTSLECGEVAGPQCSVQAPEWQWQWQWQWQGCNGRG